MAFATVDDVQSRLLAHTLTEGERAWVETMLDDAAVKLTNMVTVDASDMEQADLLCVVSCNMVIRALSPALMQTMGVTQASVTAGSYTQSMTYANASGEMYLTRDEKAQLGIIGGMYAYAEPYGGKDA